MPGSSSKNGGWQWQTYSISQSGNCHWIIGSIPSPYGYTAATKSSHPSSFRSHMHWYPTGAPSHLRMAPIHVEHNTMLVSYQQQPLSWNGKASIKVVPSLWNVKHGEQHSQEHPQNGTSKLWCNEKEDVTCWTQHYSRRHWCTSMAAWLPETQHCKNECIIFEMMARANREDTLHTFCQMLW